MKNVLTLILIVASFSMTSGQTAKDIIDQHLTAIGGTAHWEALKTMKTEASMSMQGMSFNGTISAKYPNKQLVEIDINGSKITQAYDGETAWWINPMMGSTTAQKMPEEMAGAMTGQEFESPLLNYKEKGHSVELLGEKPVEGVDSYEIRLTKKSGDVELYYFDKDSYLNILKATKITTGPTAGQMVETFFSDYQEVDGLVIPFQLEVKMGGQTAQSITFKSISLNDDLGDELFAYPNK